MHIAVIGAGLAGVTTAYELARDGHDVWVFERRAGIAAEGSFAPACVNAPGLALAQAAVRGWGGLEHWPARPGSWPWLSRRWRSARQPSHAQSLACMKELAALSLERLAAIHNAHELEYERHRGVTVALRSARAATHVQAMLAGSTAQGLPAKWFDAAQAREMEPGLADAAELHGALHWPDGDTANGRQFAHALKQEAQRLGARFSFQREVVAVEPIGRQVQLRTQRFIDAGDSVLANPSVVSSSEEEPTRFDAVVLCAADAASLAGARLPLAHTVVHSITAPLHVASEAPGFIGPHGAFLDVAEGFTASRMGERLRLAGRARLATSPAQPNASTLAALYRALDHWFPGSARTAKAQAWVGRQAHLPDGLPAVGASGAHGIWLNLAHGSNGWAWAAATARLLADQISGRTPVLDTTPLAPARLR